MVVLFVIFWEGGGKCYIQQYMYVCMYVCINLPRGVHDKSKRAPEFIEYNNLARIVSLSA